MEHAKPAAHCFYLLPYAEKAQKGLKKQLILISRLVRPTRRPFGAAVLLARKKERSLRLCIGSVLKNITLKDTYSLPRIDELLDNMAGAELGSAVREVAQKVTTLQWVQPSVPNAAQRE